MCRRIYGNEHPEVATCLSHLAALYHEQGFYSEAMPIYQEALVQRRQFFGNEHSCVKSLANSLQINLQKMRALR